MARKIDVGTLQRLSELDGPAGFEGRVRDYISDRAEELGGKVEVESQVSQGSLFGFALPAVDQSQKR